MHGGSPGLRGVATAHGAADFGRALDGSSPAGLRLEKGAGLAPAQLGHRLTELACQLVGQHVALQPRLRRPDLRGQVLAGLRVKDVRHALGLALPPPEELLESPPSPPSPTSTAPPAAWAARGVGVGVVGVGATPGVRALARSSHRLRSIVSRARARVRVAALWRDAKGPAAQCVSSSLSKTARSVARTDGVRAVNGASEAKSMTPYVQSRSSSVMAHSRVACSPATPSRTIWRKWSTSAAISPTW